MKTANEGSEEAEGEREARGIGRRRRHALPVLIVVLMTTLLAMVGCSQSGAAPQPTGSEEGDGVVQVSMAGSSFEPDAVTIEVGQSITWVNQDSVSHNAVADDGSWKTDIFGAGESRVVTFDTPSTYPYACTLHPGMTGTVTVQ